MRKVINITYAGDNGDSVTVTGVYFLLFVFNGPGELEHPKVGGQTQRHYSYTAYSHEIPSNESRMDILQS